MPGRTGLRAVLLLALSLLAGCGRGAAPPAAPACDGPMTLATFLDKRPRAPAAVRLEAQYVRHAGGDAFAASLSPAKGDPAAFYGAEVSREGDAGRQLYEALRGGGLPTLVLELRCGEDGRVAVVRVLGPAPPR